MDILDKLNIHYDNIDIYNQAFTHTSYANEMKCESYERLEFLGDAILELPSFAVSSVSNRYFALV